MSSDDNLKARHKSPMPSTSRKQTFLSSDSETEDLDASRRVLKTVNNAV